VELLEEELLLLDDDELLLDDDADFTACSFFSLHPELEEPPFFLNEQTLMVQPFSPMAKA